MYHHVCLMLYVYGIHLSNRGRHVSSSTLHKHGSPAQYVGIEVPVCHCLEKRLDFQQTSLLGLLYLCCPLPLLRWSHLLVASIQEVSVKSCKDMYYIQGLDFLVVP
uniref:Uncharacterized protein n=1 Tax=Cacopsylla melanoneura TaxID=428564 RepID=A0A8D8REJ0_9HEMI